jgi:hypothetical protein
VLSGQSLGRSCRHRAHGKRGEPCSKVGFEDDCPAADLSATQFAGLNHRKDHRPTAGRSASRIFD